MSHLTRITTAALLAQAGQDKSPISVYPIAADMDVSIDRIWLRTSDRTGSPA